MYPPFESIPIILACFCFLVIIGIFAIFLSWLNIQAKEKAKAHELKIIQEKNTFVLSQLTDIINSENNVEKLFSLAKGVITQEDRKIIKLYTDTYPDYEWNTGRNYQLTAISIARLVDFGRTNEEAAKYVLKLAKIYPSDENIQKGVTATNRVYASFFLDKISGMNECSPAAVMEVAQAFGLGLYSSKQLQIIDRIQDSVYSVNYVIRNHFNDSIDYSDRDQIISGPVTDYKRMEKWKAAYWDFLPENLRITQFDDDYFAGQSQPTTLREWIKLVLRHKSQKIQN